MNKKVEGKQTECILNFRSWSFFVSVYIAPTQNLISLPSHPTSKMSEASYISVVCISHYLRVTCDAKYFLHE